MVVVMWWSEMLKLGERRKSMIMMELGWGGGKGGDASRRRRVAEAEDCGWPEMKSGRG